MPSPWRPPWTYLPFSIPMPIPILYPYMTMFDDRCKRLDKGPLCMRWCCGYL
jgi:hypothetical protein